METGIATKPQMNAMPNVNQCCDVAVISYASTSKVVLVQNQPIAHV